MRRWAKQKTKVLNKKLGIAMQRENKSPLTILTRDASHLKKDISTADLVLLEKQKENKLSPASYESEPYKVTARHGDQIRIESPQGVTYKRNIQHLKLFNQENQ